MVAITVDVNEVTNVIEVTGEERIINVEVVNFAALAAAVAEAQAAAAAAEADAALTAADAVSTAADAAATAADRVQTGLDATATAADAVQTGLDRIAAAASAADAAASAASIDPADFATAAQGALADTATQPDANETITGDWDLEGDVTLTAATSLLLPSGPTGERPASPAIGEAFYNTSTATVDLGNGSEFRRLGTIINDVTLASDSLVRVPSVNDVKTYVDTAVGAISAGGLVPIETQTFSADATADFTGFNSTLYSDYLFIVRNVVATADADLRFRTSANGGSSYDSSAGNYGYVYKFTSIGSTAVNAATSASLDHIKLTLNTGSGAGEEGASGTVMLFAPDVATETRIKYAIDFTNNSGTDFEYEGIGKRFSSALVNAVRFYPESGNFESGSITMYGIARV